MTKRLLVFVVGVLTLGSLSVIAQSKTSVQGVWRVAEVTTTGPNGTTNTSPHPGVYIFTARHYSIVRDNATTPRPPVKDGTNPTPAEAVAAFGPFTAQAGTYAIAGTTLTMTPMVTKVPPATGKYGASLTASFKIQGDTLWLTGVTALGTKVQNPATYKLTRIE